jgi:simple sugar transport system ATP-binding protein
MQGPVLKLEGVTRRFGDFAAVREATLTIEPGVIHAIVGENGAGKSTLLKLAAGVLEPSEGTVLVDGQPLRPSTPVEAARRGIGLVHQHFMLVDAFRAIDNAVLGDEPVGFAGRLDMPRAEAKLREIVKRVGLAVPLDAVTASLSVGERQRLSILRVLYRGSRAILLDEPTAVLSPLEAQDLYATLRRLAGEGSTIVVVTHRLDEVVRFANRVTVMRRGRVVLSRAYEGAEVPAEEEKDELTRAIMGGEPPPRFAPPVLDEDAPVILQVEDLVLEERQGGRVLDGISLAVRAGEIVGIAGVEGNGQREFVHVLSGLVPPSAGRVRVHGRELKIGRKASVVRDRRREIAVVHEDRLAEGLLLDASVGENLIFGDLGDPHDGPFDEEVVIARRIARFRVVPPDPSRLASELSGGNQQKIVVARALDRLTSSGRAQGLAVLGQPTRGLDVGSSAVIHEAIVQAAAAGMGVILLSADLGELRRLSHRILVMRRGRIAQSLSPAASDEQIGRAMLGAEAA